MSTVILQSLLPELGKVIRLFREKGGKTLGFVAKSAGISISMLSQIERGVVSPSIDTLGMVCKALNLELVELFRRISPGEPVRIHRKGERLRIERGGARYEQLMTSHAAAFPVEMFLIEVAPGTETAMSGGGHEGAEIGYVLDGAARLEVGNGVYEIAQGDSIYFDARLPHRLINSNHTVFHAVWSISPPHVDYLSEKQGVVQSPDETRNTTKG